eukprot:TRINITY_DN453_c0_g1_i1.p1 TRINITY_DN453_c0_g1~~TRINITY_DN453_c0_g1_i1.p1  ORF type:complete len:249 (+),score=49.03 TRINITY_DN453_c0_g1_i1:766-1512(+)
MRRRPLLSVGTGRLAAVPAAASNNDHTQAVLDAVGLTSYDLSTLTEPESARPSVPQFLPLSNPLLAHLDKFQSALPTSDGLGDESVERLFTFGPDILSVQAQPAQQQQQQQQEEPKFIFADDVVSDSSAPTSLASSAEHLAYSSPVTSPPPSSFCSSPYLEPDTVGQLLDCKQEPDAGFEFDDASVVPLESLFSGWGAVVGVPPAEDHSELLWGNPGTHLQAGSLDFLGAIPSLVDDNADADIEASWF